MHDWWPCPQGWVRVEGFLVEQAGCSRLQEVSLPTDGGVAGAERGPGGDGHRGLLRGAGQSVQGAL